MIDTKKLVLEIRAVRYEVLQVLMWINIAKKQPLPVAMYQNIRHSLISCMGQLTRVMGEVDFNYYKTLQPNGLEKEYEKIVKDGRDLKWEKTFKSTKAGKLNLGE